MRFIYQLAIICILGLHSVNSEYIWDGREWIWVEKDANQPAKTSSNAQSEGSGGNSRSGVDTTDVRIANVDDEDEDYADGSGDEDDLTAPRGGAGVVETGVQGGGYPAFEEEDDEDVGEGSGAGYANPPVAPYPPNVDSNDNGGWNAVANNDNNNNFGYQPETTTTTVTPRYEEPIKEVEPVERDPITIDGGSEPTTTTDSPQNPSISGPKTTNNRSTSFFAQPGILAAVVGGAVVGLLCAILFVMFVVYRMRKKDEGSYALDEPKRSPTVNSYSKPPSREFYA